MHGADYDLRLLRKHHEFVPSAIFDTMLAARLLGLRQFSLSHLVQNYLGVKLEKGPQKANWAMRPLTERMERYARNDTRYLKPLSDLQLATGHTARQIFGDRVRGAGTSRTGPVSSPRRVAHLSRSRFIRAGAHRAPFSRA